MSERISADEARRLREAAAIWTVDDAGMLRWRNSDGWTDWGLSEVLSGEDENRPPRRDANLLMALIAAAPDLAATVERLEAECERHRRANLVRAVADGWNEEVDGSLTDYVNEQGWDAVPWKVAESMALAVERLEADNQRLRAALQHHFDASTDPCQDRGVDWPCDVADAFGAAVLSDEGDTSG